MLMKSFLKFRGREQVRTNYQTGKPLLLSSVSPNIASNIPYRVNTIDQYFLKIDSPYLFPFFLASSGRPFHDPLQKCQISFLIFCKFHITRPDGQRRKSSGQSEAWTRWLSRARPAVKRSGGTLVGSKVDCKKGWQSWRLRWQQ